MAKKESIFKQFEQLKEKNKLTTIPTPTKKHGLNGKKLCNGCKKIKPISEFPYTLSMKHRSELCRE